MRRRKLSKRTIERYDKIREKVERFYEFLKRDKDQRIQNFLYECGIEIIKLRRSSSSDWMKNFLYFLKQITKKEV